MSTTISSRSTTTLDWVGATLSLACAVHCLGAPVLLTAVTAFGIETGNERFETFMVYSVVAIATGAGILGLRRHGSLQPVLLLAAGASAFLFLRPAVAHAWEPIVTVGGALMVIAGHYRNWAMSKPCEVQSG